MLEESALASLACLLRDLRYSNNSRLRSSPPLMIYVTVAAQPPTLRKPPPFASLAISAQSPVRFARDLLLLHSVGCAATSTPPISDVPCASAAVVAFAPSAPQARSRSERAFFYLYKCYKNIYKCNTPKVIKQHKKQRIYCAITNEMVFVHILYRERSESVREVTRT